jgi:hypothetical protein
VPSTEATVCTKRPDCRIVERHAAGTTAAGDALVVVKVWIGAPRYPIDEYGGCPSFEWWSLTLQTGVPTAHQMLVAGGNECLQWGGGGAKIGPGSFTYVFAGSGAPIVAKGLPETTVIRLAPLAILSGPPGRAITGPDVPILDYTAW